MDREELMDLIRKGPVRIRMNDGAEFFVENTEMAAVSDIAASVLYRDEKDGKLRTVYLPLVTMSAVFPEGIEAGER